MATGLQIMNLRIADNRFIRPKFGPVCSREQHIATSQYERRSIKHIAYCRQQKQTDRTDRMLLKLCRWQCQLTDVAAEGLCRCVSATLGWYVRSACLSRSARPVNRAVGEASTSGYSWVQVHLYLQSFNTTFVSSL